MSELTSKLTEAGRLIIENESLIAAVLGLSPEVSAAIAQFRFDDVLLIAYPLDPERDKLKLSPATPSGRPQARHS